MKDCIKCIIGNNFREALLKIGICERCIKTYCRLFVESKYGSKRFPKFKIKDNCHDKLIYISQLIHEYEHIVTSDYILAYDKIIRLMKERKHTIYMYYNNNDDYIRYLFQHFHLMCACKSTKHVTILSYSFYKYYSSYEKSHKVFFQFNHPVLYTDGVSKILNLYNLDTKIIMEYIGTNEYVEGIAYSNNGTYKYMHLKNTNIEITKKYENSIELYQKCRIPHSAEILANNISEANCDIVLETNNFINDWSNYYKNTKYEFYKIKEAGRYIKSFIKEVCEYFTYKNKVLKETTVYFYIINNIDYRSNKSYYSKKENGTKFKWSFGLEENKDCLFNVKIKPFFSLRQKNEIINGITWIEKWYFLKDDIQEYLNTFLPKELTKIIMYYVL